MFLAIVYENFIGCVVLIVEIEEAGLITEKIKLTRHMKRLGLAEEVTAGSHDVSDAVET
ncbi:hypothetical protein DY000_02054446 [Brassica cretica]|uniref:Uncharacterized protein n=1 Tax=Brassica cretica TaxID=69181 RepID=A0ABQ7AHD6_BRACR|nr:hypothetical protein DY000_02054446 [Brassica cretica]